MIINAILIESSSSDLNGLKSIFWFCGDGIVKLNEITQQKERNL